MRSRVDVNGREHPPLADRIIRGLAGEYLRSLAFRLRVEALDAFDRASSRAVAWLVAASLFIVAGILLVTAGVLGLLALHVPPPAAYLSLALAAILAGAIVVRQTEPRKRGERIRTPED